MIDRLAKLCSNAWFCFAGVCAVSFVTVVLPVLIGGLHASGDLAVYLGFAQEIRSAIEQGRYFPGWANDNLGYGSVGIRFYPPVGYYTAAIVWFIVGDWYASICIFLFVWMVVGCWGVFLFVREWSSPLWALAAAGLYAVVPFHLAEIYQFTLYGEFAAGGILPFCFLFATRLCRGSNWTDILGFAISSAALVLTHIPTTLIGAASLPIYVLMMIERPRIGRTAVNFAMSGAMVLAASSFYWIRVVTEVDWLAHAQPQYSAVLGGHSNWFFPYLLTASNAPEYFRPVLRSFDAMVILMAALLLPSIALVVSRRDLAHEMRRGITALSVVGVFGLFMLSYASFFVWDRVEILQKIQFPWRWLTVVSVVAVVSFVLSIASRMKNGGAFRKISVLFLVALIGLIVAYDIRKNFTHGNVVSKTEFETILTAKDSPAGSNFAAWWPVWAKADALAVTDKVSARSRAIEISDWQAELRTFRIGEGVGTAVRLATFYYPHWKATVNGESVEVGRDESGAITMLIPANASEVRMYFEEPLVNIFCFYLSVVCWLAIAVAIVVRAVAVRR